MHRELPTDVMAVSLGALAHNAVMEFAQAVDAAGYHTTAYRWFDIAAEILEETEFLAAMG